MPTERRAIRLVFACAPAVLGAMRTAVLLLAAGSAVACRQDMHDQPKYSALEQSSFFPDGSSARVPIAGTVARGELRDDSVLYTGKQDDEPASYFPIPVDASVMARGQERFNVYCSPCHGRTGEGDGLVVQRGFSRPPSLLEPRLREAAPGHFFEVITNGYGAMPDHAAQIKAVDRWAIAAYIRALQLAGSATLDDVPSSERSKLEGR